MSSKGIIFLLEKQRWRTALLRPPSKLAQETLALPLCIASLLAQTPDTLQSYYVLKHPIVRAS
jgi:hypothetical protein